MKKPIKVGPMTRKKAKRVKLKVGGLSLRLGEVWGFTREQWSGLSIAPCLDHMLCERGSCGHN